MKPNILLLTIDALRADHLGCYGAALPTSPNLDALASESVLFMRAISQGAGTPTSFPSLLSGRYVSSDEDRGYCGENRELLSQMLQREDYQCGCIQTSPFLMTEFGYNKGYDFFDQSYLPWLRNYQASGIGRLTSRKLIPAPLRWLYRQGLKAINNLMYRQSALPASIVTRKIVKLLRTLRKAGKPSFLFAHYEDVHEPYAPSAKYVKMFAPNKPNARKLMFKGRYMPDHLSWEETESLARVYDAGIRMVDEWLGTLFQQLREDGIFDDTLIIITADHGDGFNEHGFVSHPQILYNELLHVPLIIKFPYSKHKGKLITNPVRLIDIVPTIFHIMGGQTPDNLDGISLLPMIEESGPGPESCISEAYRHSTSLMSVAVQEHFWKLIRLEMDTEEPFHRLFNLKSDPGERHNLYAQKPAPLAALEKTLEQHLVSRYKGELEPIPDVSEIVTDRLRALGYIE